MKVFGLGRDIENHKILLEIVLPRLRSERFSF